MTWMTRKRRIRRRKRKRIKTSSGWLAARKAGEAARMAAYLEEEDRFLDDWSKRMEIRGKARNKSFRNRSTGGRVLKPKQLPSKGSVSRWLGR